MNDTPTRPPEAQPEPPRPLPVDVAAIPVDLRFEVGTLSLPFAEARRLGPGFVFELARPLSRESIRIVANDALIGYGELVTVGELLGVRVTSLCTRPGPAED